MLSRLSYANVVATVALFIALGGSSYAALKLPRNSVGSAQIRNGSVQPRDLSAAARGGGGGGKVFFAHVGAGGKADRGNSTFAALESAGHYEVGFSQAPNGCAWTATIASVDDNSPPSGTITAHQDGDHVGIQVYDGSGQPASLPFNVIMAC